MDEIACPFSLLLQSLLLESWPKKREIFHGDRILDVGVRERRKKKEKEDGIRKEREDT